ncbi:MAG: hypothetical protein A4E49_02781 [Methanosaeta sp. PtaU1.Bin112]|nr:MAG: hypothetical protein A4E49_02781 [Methanosaeta sp. PtaU1.Bin112]
MNNRLSICILLSLAILASGLAEAQGTYGTKVQAGDPDIGLPLSDFAPIPVPGAADPLWQNNFWISYWDLNANGLYDAQDVPYLQFGSSNVIQAQRIVRANNIRLAAWGSYPAGSYVKASDPDIGQQLNTVPPFAYALPSGFFTGFYYLNVAGTAGYDMEDPVYLKVLSNPLPIQLGTNDIRITGYANYPAGSRVSITDPDAGKGLSLFKFPAGFGNGGPTITTAGQIGTFMFFNANGNIATVPPNPAFSAIFDDGDVVYFHVGAGGAGAAVGPNDIRMF